jgi:hypothetical protein
MEQKDWNNVYKVLEKNFKRIEQKKTKRKRSFKRVGYPTGVGFPIYGYGSGFNDNSDGIYGYSSNGDGIDSGDAGCGDGGGGE